MDFKGFEGEDTPSSFESMTESESEGSAKSETMPGIEHLSTEQERAGFRARRYKAHPPTSNLLALDHSDSDSPKLDGLRWEVQETPPWRLLGFTRVGSRKVVMVAAGFMIFFSVIDVFGAFFASLPLSIVAGWFVILNGCVVAVGTSFLQFCNHNSHRNMLVLGISLCMGVSIPTSMRQMLITHGHGVLHSVPWLSNTLVVFLSSQATVATIVGICMDMFIRRCKKTKIEAGYLWKKRFIDPQSARRTRKYYALPPNPLSWFRPGA